MNLEEIVSQLKNERGRLDTAITALESVGSDSSQRKSSNKAWTPERRRKYKATIAAKKKAHK